jgi:VanZ like protein
VHTSGSGGTRVATWGPVAVAFAFIGALTLVPLPHGNALDDIPFWCLGCGDYALADAVANVVLFVPLGWALSRTGLRWSLGLAVVVITTVGIEGLQYRFLPGRVASIADILANTVGGGVGLMLPRLPRRLIETSERTLRASIVYAVLVVACLGVGEATQAILPPRTLLWTRGEADGVQYVPFSGTLRELRVDGAPITLDRWVAEPSRESTDVVVELTSGRPDTGLAHVVIAWMPNGQGWLWLEQRDRDLHLHLASLSDRAKLRGHSVWLRGVMPVAAAEPVTIRVAVRTFSYRVAVVTNAGPATREACITPGDGWRLLAPGTQEWGLVGLLLTGVWMAGLFAPLGYLASLASLASRAAAAAAAVGGAVVLVLVPIVSGCASLALPGWCGAAAGFLIGWFGARATPTGRASRPSPEAVRPQPSSERSG